MHRQATSATAASDGQYCSRFWAEWNKASVPQKYPAGAQSNAICGYNGPQLRALYGLSGTDRGPGQTIVIVGTYNSPTALADANTTFAANGVPPLPAARYQVKTYPAAGGDATGCEEAGWNVEQALDIQAVHTIAPDASIVYAAAADCTKLEETLAGVITDASLNTTLISASWGVPAEPDDPAYLAAVNSILARAVILGIGVYFSSGDAGDNSASSGTGAVSVAYPASSPWVTAVGGTSSAIGANNQVLWQTGWEAAANALTGGQWTRLAQPFAGGAGGGASAHFTKPTWQAALPGSKRLLPDIAALADPLTGFTVGYTLNGQYVSTPLGGTSLAAPIVAGLAALAQARAGAASDIGLLAPVLYAKSTAAAAVTTDVRHVTAGVWTPSVSVHLPDGDYLIDVDAGAQSLATTPGFDNVTGLGVPGPTFLAGITS
jgi:subtilase family serine protease